MTTELPHQTNMISCLLRHVLYCVVSGALNNLLVVITEPPSQSTRWTVRQWCQHSHRLLTARSSRSCIPFLQAALVEQIAKLVDAGTLSGVSDVRDESDRDGMRVVVELKRGGWA